MPKHEPAPEDPLALHGVRVPDPGGDAVERMAACIAEEFLRLGHGPGEVLELFRSPRYGLPHRAWRELGEVRIFTLVSSLAAARRPAPGSPRAHGGQPDA